MKGWCRGRNRIGFSYFINQCHASNGKYNTPENTPILKCDFGSSTSNPRFIPARAGTRPQKPPPQPVSILARTKARALPTAQVLALQKYVVFQSSPAPRRGRYNRESPMQTCMGMFQSSPAPRRGRYMLNFRSSPLRYWFQSSPAPRRGRYGFFSF